MSRPQLYALGVTRSEIRVHVWAGRWRKLSDQAVALRNGPLDLEGHRWAAVLQGGPRAMLDGVAALQAAGLERFESDSIRVSVPRGAKVRRTRMYDIRQTRRLSASDRASTSGPPRTRVPVAAIRAGLWARTERQAVYLVTLTVQQGLATPEQLGLEMLRIKRARRRLLLSTVIADLLDGARSLGEIDVGRELELRGLPRPDRQVLRRDSGRYYLDLYWDDLGVVVEVDGIQHTWAENVVGDALRQNSLTLAHDTVLRLPLLGLRLQPDDFYAQIEQAITDATEHKAA